MMAQPPGDPSGCWVGLKAEETPAPLVTRVVVATTSTRAVVGVIGGYQEGGDYADISYSPRFLANVAALYKVAN